MTRIYFIVALLGLLAAARGQVTNTNSLQPLSLTTNSPALSGRVLVVGDIVDVRVYQEDDLYTRARVENNGSISMPLLGAIFVAGKTVEQACETIHDLLQKSYLQKPQVSLTVVDAAKRRFCIMGEVRQPGYYQMPDNDSLTLLQAISLAGGYTAYAQPRKISIKRLVNGVETVKVVDARSMAKNSNVTIISIEPNDTIIVSNQLF